MVCDCAGDASAMTLDVRSRSRSDLPEFENGDLKFFIMLTVDTFIETSFEYNIPEEILDDILERLQKK